MDYRFEGRLNTPLSFTSSLIVACSDVFRFKIVGSKFPLFVSFMLVV